MLARSDIPADVIEQLVFGQVVQMPEAPNIAREIVLGTGMNVHTDAYSVSRACATSFQAVANVAESLMAGSIRAGIAGGADSSSVLPIGVSKKLARVLVDTPHILILDEATANIDSGTEQAIQQALAKVRQHTTLVVIAHRLSTIVEADTILVLHRGQAVERGSHQQLLAARGRYWQMYQLQLAGEELAASAQEESLIA